MGYRSEAALDAGRTRARGAPRSCRSISGPNPHKAFFGDAPIHRRYSEGPWRPYGPRWRFSIVGQTSPDDILPLPVKPTLPKHATLTVHISRGSHEQPGGAGRTPGTVGRLPAKHPQGRRGGPNRGDSPRRSNSISLCRNRAVSAWRLSAGPRLPKRGSSACRVQLLSVRAPEPGSPGMPDPAIGLPQLRPAGAGRRTDGAEVRVRCDHGRWYRGRPAR